jgi:4-phytase/acid phosphatase
VKTASIPLCICLCFTSLAAPAHRAKQKPELKYVVVLSRHGVRSPSKANDELNVYSSKPWPMWSVAPELLTAHGAQQMSLVGTYDRAYYAQAGLFAASGCADAASVFVYADSNQRTQITAQKLADSMFPGCKVDIHGRPLEKPDLLFHPSFTEGQKAAAVAGVRERIQQATGGDDMIDALTAKYKPQLEMLNRVLEGCSADVQAPCPSPKPAIAEKLFEVDAKLKPGKNEKLLNFKGPLATASSLAEDLELEYTEGLPAAEVGWGHVDGPTLRGLLQLHGAANSVEQRALPVARAQAGPLLTAIEASLQQAADGKPVAGALGAPGDKLLLLTGHEGNLTGISALLHLTWDVDGMRDHVPPGAALVFELWKDSAGYSVRVAYMAQTLEQIRTLAPLTLASPPVHVTLRPCGSDPCSLSQFEALAK